MTVAHARLKRLGETLTSARGDTASKVPLTEGLQIFDNAERCGVCRSDRTGGSLMATAAKDLARRLRTDFLIPWR